MGEQIARYKPGENLSGYAKADIVEGRFVKIVGKTAKGAYEIEHAGNKAAALTVLGVSQRSALSSLPAASQDRLVEVVNVGAVARVKTGEEIKVGEAVMSGAAGIAMKSTENPLGVALSTAVAEAYVEVALRL